MQPGDEVVLLGRQGDESWQQIDAREMAGGDRDDSRGRSSAGSARGSSDNTVDSRPVDGCVTRLDMTVVLRMTVSRSDRYETPKTRVRLPGVRRAGAEVDGPLRRVRRLELAGRGAAGRSAGAGAGGGNRYSQLGARRVAQAVRRRRDRATPLRLSTGIGEFDRVLGGGIVPGSLVLLGGEPGIGKSTLLLQAAAHFAREVGPVLYASGEESEHQIKSRGDRLGVGDAPLYLLSETCIERILEEIARLKPALVIVDSVQTVFSMKFQSAPGSIGQVREAATQFLFAAKGQNIPTVLVGHVTKDGSLAGPKVLEHVVDTVLYFEGERHHSHRVVRAVKNRFGAVSELGVFEMTGTGLRPVPNPSKLFLSERASGTPGLGGAVLRRRVAADPGRGAGAGQHQHLRQRPADGDRHRSEPAVAAAGGAREARRPEPGRRRCLREHRRRDDHRRAGRRPERRGGGGLERAQPRPGRRRRRCSAKSA